MARPWTADALVIFGITGDLARRMTFPALYLLEQRGLLDCPVVGVAGTDLTTAQLADRGHKAIEEAGEPVVETIFGRLAGRLAYVQGDVTDPGLYQRLAVELRGRRRPLFYLAMPPDLYAPIVEQLSGAHLVQQARVALEKPFGHDLASAKELNSRLHQVLEEQQILRVDHFLGKEPVIEIEYLRFANFALAELWHRDSVEAIQITMAQDFGVADRGHFYDQIGALRDVVQNHLLQVLALVTMDPPVGPTPDDLRDKKAEVLRAMPEAEVAHYVRGQYSGYQRVPGVASGSDTETFTALRLTIDNWRWAGIPVFIRAGKQLPVRATEVRLVLKAVPELRFLPDPARVEANQIVLRIDPDPGLRLQLSALGQGATWREVPLDTVFARELGKPLAPYERLLHAAMTGDDRYFAREDAVEESWRIVQPLLAYPPAVHSYTPGSWGPPEAATLLVGHPPWQQPWLPSLPAHPIAAPDS
ncbi:MAG: glucose-6-phosphate dehydrogenase [Nocardiopsaceae bacterium]|jgi:glucose-6-phosphate 1-dehydrogenase|nr:glucose-6-phosphate dehydrogenase [Nocardiopsaceae bacterium]